VADPVTSNNLVSRSTDIYRGVAWWTEDQVVQNFF